jgi:PAS domain S-box-containing protein
MPEGDWMSQAVRNMSGEDGFSAKPSRGQSLRTRLLLLVGLCILPLFFFGFGNAYFDYQGDRAEAGRQALNMARTLSLLIQRDLEARLDTLQVLALSHTLQVGDIVGFRALAEVVLAQQLPGERMLLLREDGQQVMNTGLPPDAPLPARRDKTNLLRLFSTAHPSVSDVFVSVVTHRPIVALEVPVLRQNGSVIYSLALNPTDDAFANILHRQQFGGDSIVSIVDRQGVIIARSPNDAQYVGKMAGPAVLPRLSTQLEGIAETTSQEGVPVVAAFTHVPTFGWSVVLGLNRTKLIETGTRAAWVTFAVGTTCLMLGLGLALVMARRIAGPIASLRWLSIALEKNGSEVTVATGLAETDEVAQALITASDRRHAAETATRRAEWEREQSSALLRTVVETTPSLIYAKNLKGQVVLANGAFLEILGKTRTEVVGRTDIAFRSNQAQAETMVTTDRRIMSTGQAEICEELIGNEGNQPRVWLSTKTPLHNADGEVVGLVGVSVEITERKQAEDRLRQMVNELNHRVKNTLATVQSIASHTLRGADRAIGRTLEARLMALASAHDVLTREEWEGANLTDVIAGALTPYGGVEDSRFHVSGPPLRLMPRAAVALAMGLHELTTNALKYGSLSVGGGQVDITWATVKAIPPHLHMIWSERNGPPVTQPVELGFGTRLIERSLAQDLGGTAQITFAAGGIICVIDAPLDEVVPTAKVIAFPKVG